jgi:hypothetical protein
MLDRCSSYFVQLMMKYCFRALRHGPESQGHFHSILKENL